MHFRFEHLFHVSARLCSDDFDFGAFVANHHLLLPFALNQNQTVNVITATFVSHEALDLNRNGVRQFSTQEAHQFFTDHL